MTAACVDLQERFGRRYRVTLEANGTTKGQWPQEERPWLQEIRGHAGVVYPKGGEILAAMTDRPRLGAKLRALPCTLATHGDLETIITFHVDDAPAVFRLIRPYRRRQVSAAERERLTALSAPFRFTRRHAVDDAFPALESTINTTDNPEAV